MATDQDSKLLGEIDKLYDDTGYAEAEAEAERHRRFAESILLQAGTQRSAPLTAYIESLQQSPDCMAALSTTLLHFYGIDIEEEVLRPARSRGFDSRQEEGWQQFLEVAEDIEEHDRTPLIIDSTIDVGPGPGWEAYTQRTVHVVLANGLFYSHREVEDGLLMHAFTGERGSVMKRTFGLHGQVRSAKPRLDQMLGEISNLSEVGDQCELIRHETRIDGRSSGGGSYSYSGTNRSLIAGDECEQVDTRYTVGWPAIEARVLAEPTLDRKVQAARNVAFLVSSGHEPNPMPRVASVLAAAQAVEDVT